MVDLDQAGLAWCLVDRQLIFLDVAADRYFRLPDARNQELVEQIETKARPPWQQPSSLLRPDDWASPRQGIMHARNGGFQLARVARAIWVQRRIEARLRKTSLHQVLNDVRRLVEHRTTPAHQLSEAGRATLRAFEQARLLRTAADRCLPRSLAVATCLAASGDHSRVVLAVRSLPFGAHCWAQHGDLVINDSLEEVSRFQPILVV